MWKGSALSFCSNIEARCSSSPYCAASDHSRRAAAFEGWLALDGLD
jgi:hypothetical protein